MGRLRGSPGDNSRWLRRSAFRGEDDEIEREENDNENDRDEDAKQDKDTIVPSSWPQNYRVLVG